MKDTYVRVRCSEADKERVRAGAEKRQMDMSEYILYLVRMDEERYNHPKTMLTVKCYQSNATVFGDGESINMFYNADYCDGYTTDEYMREVKDEILDEFPRADEDSLEDILNAIRIHVDGFCK